MSLLVSSHIYKLIFNTLYILCSMQEVKVPTDIILDIIPDTVV